MRRRQQPDTFEVPLRVSADQVDAQRKHAAKIVSRSSGWRAQMAIVEIDALRALSEAERIEFKSQLKEKARST